MEDIHALSATGAQNDFEWFCKFLLTHFGYERISVSDKHGVFNGDGGIDLTAHKGGEKYLVQCKKLRRGFQGFLPLQIIRELAGCLDKRPDCKAGIIITTVLFDESDYREADAIFRGSSKHIHLIGFAEIAAAMRAINPLFSVELPPAQGKK